MYIQFIQNIVNVEEGKEREREKFGSDVWNIVISQHVYLSMFSSTST